MTKERLSVELYQVFRDYSNLDISYNQFCSEMDKFAKTLKTKEVKANEFNIEKIK